MPIVRSLSTKLILAVVITITVTLSVGVAYFMKIERNQFKETMMSETGQISTMVLASLDRSMMENDSGRTVELLKTLSSTKGVDHLTIVNSRGIVALSSMEDEEGESLDIEGGLCTVCHEGEKPKRQLVFNHINSEGEEVFRNLIPILNRVECQSCHKGRLLGILISDIGAETLKIHEASQIQRFILLAIVIFLVITLLLWTVVNFIIRRPIKALIKGTKEMARGNYNYRLAEASNDELGYLAHSFNEMAVKVDKSRAILEKWNVSLEEEVERRTEELRISAQKLEEEKTRTESIIHSVVEGVLSVSRDGTIMLASQPAADIFGCSEAALLGRSLNAVIRESAHRFQNFDAIMNFFRIKKESTEGYLGEIEQIQPQRRTYKLSRSRMKGRKGGHRGWVFSFHDITREKEIDEIKTNLVAMVSHELRTPLTAIKGALALIVEGKLIDDEESREFKQIALTNTDRLIELINNLLDLSKIESGSIFYEHGNFYLDLLMKRSIEAVSAFAERNRVTFVLDIQESIKEVRGDASKIEQVIINLLSNAVKFSPEGGEVHLSVEDAGIEYIIKVADKGIGISPQEQKKIFDKFYQVDMTSVRHIGGSGLGLSICRAIVEGHEGRIWVESEPGKGSSFYFSLPKEMAAEEPAEIRAPRRSAAAADLIPHSVLVVEDEDAVRRVLTKYLEEKGFEVLQAANAKEALRLARVNRPDCITVDVMLPDFDGFDLTAILKSDPKTRKIPVIFLTVVEGEGKARGLNLGAEAYFTKPVEYGEVVEKIESTLAELSEGKHGGKILLVDDEPDVISPISTYLDKRGYRTRCATSGQEALELIEQEVPDLLVLDLRMPGMSGYELIRKMKNKPKLALVPIIVITASEEEKSRKEVMGMGATAYFRKPLYPEVLWEEIKRIIN